MNRKASNRQIKIGLSLIILSILAFFVSMQSLGLFGYHGPFTVEMTLKSCVPILAFSIGVYGVSYVRGEDHKVGVTRAITWLVVMYLLILAGFIRSKFK